MSRIRRSIVLTGAGLLVTLTACSSASSDWRHPFAYSENMTESPEDHAHRLRRIREHDRRALVDDLDLLFMTDRSGRLTRWHDR